MAVSLVGLAHAETEGKRQPGAFFERIDADGDGKVTQAEAPAQAWDRLSKRDADGDGAVSREELAGGGRPGRGGANPLQRMFQFLDENGDDSISQEEAGERWERLSRLDRDGSGAVTKDELPAMRGGPGGRAPGGFFDRLDEDGDGAISQEEAGERWERLGKLDQDSDGSVSKGELARGMANRPGGPGGRGGPGGQRNPEQLFSRMDKDGDGELIETEVPAQFWEKLSRADADGSGSISKDELTAARNRAPGAGGGGNPGAGTKPKRPPLEE